MMALRPPARRLFSSNVNGKGSLAVVFGGFGFTPRQLTKHEDLYRQHGFDCLPVLRTIPQLITPERAREAGKELAVRVQEVNVPTVIHTISGSFWTAMYLLAHLEPEWRERMVKAIMFDSCPPKSDVYAFGGWLSWLLHAKAGIPKSASKPIVSQLFHPVRPAFGITADWTAENDALMFGDEARGRLARELPPRSGSSVQECTELAAAAVELAASREAPDLSLQDACVVPRNAACLFVRGRNDPVIEPQYVDEFYAFVKARSTANVSLHLFEKSQHAMAIVEAPEQYKAQHVASLLRQVPAFAEKQPAEG